MSINILKHGTVACRPDQMYGWPGITRAANGDILVSASERKFHICPFGREVVIRSTDEGETWGLPLEIYNSELDDRDGNITTLKDGTVVQSWFTSTAFESRWPERAARITDKIRQEVTGTWMLKSHDHGHTWDKEPLRIPVGMHISPIELSDSSLISIGWENRFEDDHDKVQSVYKSTDQGKTWRHCFTFDVETIDDGKGNKKPIINENHVLEVSPGKLTALFRKNGDCLQQSFSEDFGETWSKPIATEMWGCPVHMLKLSNGSIMAAFGHRREPFSIRAVFSYDNCQTWDTENFITIHQWDTQPDMGYPVSIEMEPGKIMTVFYCSRRRQDPETWEPVNHTSPEGILYTIFEVK